MLRIADVTTQDANVLVQFVFPLLYIVFLNMKVKVSKNW